jgi:hypothetical protein
MEKGKNREMWKSITILHRGGRGQTRSGRQQEQRHPQRQPCEPQHLLLLLLGS